MVIGQQRINTHLIELCNGLIALFGSHAQGGWLIEFDGRRQVLQQG